MNVGNVNRKPTNLRRVRKTVDKNIMMNQTKTELAVTRLVEKQWQRATPNVLKTEEPGIGKDATCWNCKKVGRLSRDCPIKWKTTTCYGCRSTHLANLYGTGPG